MVAILFAIWGCDGSPPSSGGKGDGRSGDAGAVAAGTASCTLSQMIDVGGTTAMQQICQERTNATVQEVEQIRQLCVFPSQGMPDSGVATTATFTQAPCSHVGALGGCRLMVGAATATIWYYQTDGFTSDDIRMLCAGIGAAFVSP